MNKKTRRGDIRLWQSLFSVYDYKQRWANDPFYLFYPHTRKKKVKNNNLDKRNTQSAINFKYKKTSVCNDEFIW